MLRTPLDNGACMRTRAATYTMVVTIVSSSPPLSPSLLPSFPPPLPSYYPRRQQSVQVLSPPQPNGRDGPANPMLQDRGGYGEGGTLTNKASGRLLACYLVPLQSLRSNPFWPLNNTRPNISRWLCRVFFAYNLEGMFDKNTRIASSWGRCVRTT